MELFDQVKELIQDDLDSCNIKKQLFFIDFYLSFLLYIAIFNIKNHRLKTELESYCSMNGGNIYENVCWNY